MPVNKYRRVEDMPGDRPLRPLDPKNLRIAFELSELARALGGWRFEPGVRKFRSVEEAWRARCRREERAARLARARRIEKQSSGSQ